MTHSITDAVKMAIVIRKARELFGMEIDLATFDPEAKVFTDEQFEALLAAVRADPQAQALGGLT